MSKQLISIIIGLFLTLGTGTLVYKTKKSPYIPTTDTTVTVTSNSQIPEKTQLQVINRNDLDDDEEDDSDDKKGGFAKTQINPGVPTKFRVDDLVKTTTNLNVRTNASIYGNILDTKIFGSTGKIIGGPINADKYTWWKIDYTTNPDGWSVENSLVSAISVVTPTQTAPQTTTSSGITLAIVAQHSTRSSCWSVINGSVYDLTSWIPNHPGGEKPILSSCGVDGSARYNGKHGGSQKTATILGGFKLGALAN